jgi:hypothetical protein
LLSLYKTPDSRNKIFALFLPYILMHPDMQAVIPDKLGVREIAQFIAI